MKTRIQKWGDCLGLRIPKALAELIGFQVNSEFDLVLEQDEIIVCMMRDPENGLQELLSGVTEENLHQKMETGELVGKEIW